MAKFVYRARTLEGRADRGTAEAADREELLRDLRAQGKYCVDAREVREARSTQKPLKTKNLIVLCRQLGAMLGAGISMSHALNTLYESSENPKTKAAALSLYEGVMKGKALSLTMQEQGKTFPPLLVHMTEAGEASGTLDTIMNNMADHFTQEQEMKKKLQGALIYPVLLVVVSIVVVGFLLTSVMPQFFSMYDGVALPMPTRVLLAVSNFLTGDWKQIIGVILAALFIFAALMTRPGFRVAFRKGQLHSPGVGKLLRTVLTARFASTFSILITSGISILNSMAITSRVMHNDYVEQQLEVASRGLEQGRMLSQTLREAEVFDPVLLTMIAAGEESGSLDDILNKTGKFFQREAEAALSQMIAMIEPVMIIILGVIIGFTILAIMMPIFGMYQQVL